MESLLLLETVVTSTRPIAWLHSAESFPGARISGMVPQEGSYYEAYSFRGILLHDINRQRSANQCYRLALKGIFFKILTTSYNLKRVYQIVKGFFFN